MPQTLFISDLHLDRERPHIITLFNRFLQQQASHAEALYILGDLFEYWIGDDDPAAGLESVIDSLKALSDKKVPVFFIHGNRDFLIGKRFSARTGCHLLEDFKIIDLYDTRTLIMHGDTLCTDDKAYQSYRAKIRNKLVLRILSSLSLGLRQKIARYLREKSRRETEHKTADIMDVNQHAVEQAMLTHNVSRLIHGHTHRPAMHAFELQGRQAIRYVLGDWYTQGSVLRCTPHGCQLDEVS